jgi:trans-2,3-dihydro-3-hydroxyanthranilate isomerase
MRGYDARMQLEYRVLDVFTDRPLAGNPLGLFPRSSQLDSEQMQAIARELNLSETVFITEQTGDNAWRARIFTPGMEVPFAGHPSIGCSWYLFHEAAPELTKLELHLQGGIVKAAVALDRYSQPLGVGIAPPPVAMGAVIDDMELVAGLYGITPDDIADIGPAQVQSVGLRYLQVPLLSLKALERCRPNVELLGHMDKEHGFNQLACFTLETYTQDATAAVRMFAPFHGVYEDPATGSNAACLATYLRAHDLINDCGDNFLSLDQGYSIQRPSRLFIRANQEGPDIRVQIAGECVEVMRGTMAL